MKLPVPPFDLESATAKIKAAENVWNTRKPDKVILAYTEDTEWRNRDEFLNGRKEIYDFLVRKWEKELDYKLRKDLWAYQGNRIAVRFEYEWRNSEDQWFRSYGNENWEFNKEGYMCKRFASINDLKILESDRYL